MGKVHIGGLSHAELLAGLFNNSRPLGMGWFQWTDEDLTIEEAKEILDLLPYPPYVDYLKGRVIKTKFEGTEIRSDLYDRDNGQGAFQKVVNKLNSKPHGNQERSTPAPVIRD